MRKSFTHFMPRSAVTTVLLSDFLILSVEVRLLLLGMRVHVHQLVVEVLVDLLRERLLRLDRRLHRLGRGVHAPEALPPHDIRSFLLCIHANRQKVTAIVVVGYTCTNPLVPKSGDSSACSAAAFATGRKSARSRRHVSARLTSASSATSKDSASSVRSERRRTRM